MALQDMNVIEAAKAAGLSTLVDTLSKTNHHYAISNLELERFAQIIRNQALEDALAEVEQGIWFDKTTDQILESIATAIRAMKKEQPLRDVPCTCAGYQDGWHSRTCAKRCL